MAKLKKVLAAYLIVSSVIFHVIAGFVIVSFGSAIMSGYETANEFAKASAGRATNLGTVKDVSVLKDGENTYVGYAVDYKGQTLYVMGTSEDVKKGDEVAVTISKHPYGPLKTLLVTVTKNGP